MHETQCSKNNRKIGVHLAAILAVFGRVDFRHSPEVGDEVTLTFRFGLTQEKFSLLKWLLEQLVDVGERLDRLASI